MDALFHHMRTRGGEVVAGTARSRRGGRGGGGGGGGGGRRRRCNLGTTDGAGGVASAQGAACSGWRGLHAGRGLRAGRGPRWLAQETFGAWRPAESEHGEAWPAPVRAAPRCQVPFMYEDKARVKMSPNF